MTVLGAGPGPENEKLENFCGSGSEKLGPSATLDFIYLQNNASFHAVKLSCLEIAESEGLSNDFRLNIRKNCEEIFAIIANNHFQILN